MYAHIITNAICGKGKKLVFSNHDITASNPISEILGCWVFNHQFTATKIDNEVIVEGSYEISLWYAYDNQTKTGLTNSTVSYKDQITVSIDTTDLLSDDIEIIVKVLKQPKCVDTSYKPDSNEAKIKVERETLALLAGQKKLKVMTEPSKDY